MSAGIVNPALEPAALAEAAVEGSHEHYRRASKHRMVSNTVFSVLSYVAYLPINLLVARFVVERLGIATFGLWAALTTVMAFQSLLDLGVATPLIKYVSEYATQGKAESVNVVLATGMVFYAVVSAVFALIMVVASSWVLVHLFHSSAGNASLRAMYFSVVGGFSISLTFSVFQSLILGIQRADVQARLLLFYNMASAVGTVALLMLGLGLKGLAINWFASVLITVTGNWIAAKKLYPQLRVNPFQFELKELRRILGFSTKVQVSTIALFMNGQVDRVLISYALGPATLGFYQLAQRATQALTGFSSALSTTVLPAVSEMATSGQWDRLRELYLRATRYQAMTVFPLTAGLAGLAFPVVHAWLGPGFNRAAVTMIILLVSYAIWLPNGATVAALSGIGRPDVRMRGDIVLVVVHVPLAAFCIWRFGYFGTVFVTSSLLICSRVYIFVAGGRELKTPLLYLIRRSLLQPAIGSLLALGAVLALQMVVPSESLPILAAECIDFSGIYLLYLLLIGFDSQDLSLIKMAIERLIPSRLRGATSRAFG